MPVGPRRYSDEQIRFVLERARQGLTHTQIVDAYRSTFNVTRDFGLAQVKYIKLAYGEAPEFGVPAMNRVLRQAGEAPRRSMSNEPTLESLEGTAPSNAITSPTYAQHLSPERPHEEQLGCQGLGTLSHDDIPLIETIFHGTPRMAAHGQNQVPPPVSRPRSKDTRETVDGNEEQKIQHRRTPPHDFSKGSFGRASFALHPECSATLARGTPSIEWESVYRNLHTPSVPPEAASPSGGLNPSTLYSLPGGTSRISQPPQDPRRPPDDRQDAVMTHTGPHDACQIHVPHFHGASGAVGFPHVKELQQHVARMVAQEMAKYFMPQQVALPQRPPV